jgi:hypothetical protein
MAGWQDISLVPSIEYIAIAGFTPVVNSVATKTPRADGAIRSLKR